MPILPVPGSQISSSVMEPGAPCYGPLILGGGVRGQRPGWSRLWLTQSLSSTSRSVVSCLLIDVLGYQEGRKGLLHGWALFCDVV
ncbi:unnamed protein product [Arctogadus glacialis]